MKTRELSDARVAIYHHDFANAFFLLEHARRVAIAQRKPAELLEARELVVSIREQSYGSTRDASERLARKVDEGLRGFSYDELASAGVEPESVGVAPEPDLDVLVAGWKLRTPAGHPAATKTRELARARAALDEHQLASALFLLRQAERVAVAQRKLDELIEVYELVQVLSERSSGRTHAASEQLERQVEAGLRSFAQGETA
jgi:hypothetical protein